MANTPIPRTATEMAVRPCSDMEEYTLSPEALEEIRKKYPKPENTKRPKTPIEIKPGGAKRMAKEGPDSGLTKKVFLEERAKGASISAIERNWEMKYNTLPDWVKKWGVQGISPEEAKRILSGVEEEPAPPVTPGKNEEQDTQKRINDLISERNLLVADNRDLHTRLAEASSRATDATKREREANAKVGEYLQAIQELQERVRDLEAAEPPALPPIAELVPKKATELQRIDGIIEDLSRARWILERVEG